MFFFQVGGYSRRHNDIMMTSQNKHKVERTKFGPLNRKAANRFTVHMNGEMEHVNAILEHTNQADLTSGTSNHPNGCGIHVNGDISKSLFHYGEAICEEKIDPVISLKQTDQGRLLISESHSICEQSNNEEPMYQLCDRLSYVGMEDEKEDHMCQQNVQPAFSDNIAMPSEQMPIIWTNENLFKQDKDGDTYLHIAIILQQMDLAIDVINEAPTHRLLSSMNKMSQSPIYLAVLTNQIDIVRRLMVGGAEIVSRDRKGATPLHVACEKGYRDAVKKLLEPVRYHETKMNTNYEIPYQKIPQDLEIANYDGKTVLHVAYEGGHYDIVKLLIEKRANVNARHGKTGRTILHCACLDGRVELVRFLLTLKECNINAKSYDDFTPFDFARIRGHTEIAILLAQAGACNRDDDDMSD